MQTVEWIDSHTAGEPTRVVIAGGPDLGQGPISERLQLLRDQGDWLRRCAILEPRGYDWLVGAILLEPSAADCEAAVIFFNNAGYLQMCGHGMIGVVATLAHQGRIGPGQHQFETPAGVVTAELHADHTVSIQNVASYRLHKDYVLPLEHGEAVTGDIAYGGNWFFLTAVDELEPKAIPQLMRQARAIRHALDRQTIPELDGAVIDHIELVGPPGDKAQADSRSFVLCPGGEYDRSPCGTGTSAKLACLAADGRLQPGQTWRQESILGGLFEGRYEVSGDKILPTITGRAWVTGETRCLLAADDPYRYGIETQPALP